MELFRQYANVDLTGEWTWNGIEDAKARERLDSYIRLRGDVVHRSRKISSGLPQRHPVLKEDLEKAVSFLKRLVEVTEKACAAQAHPQVIA